VELTNLCDLKINTWLIAPYKKPERDLLDNTLFNNHVSMVRIRSEHAIGFLKGRFHSLKRLRVNIQNKKSHKLATYWVAACIGLHSFAMQCEDEENPDRDTTNAGTCDPFIDEGLSSSSQAESDQNAHHAPTWSRSQQQTTNRLQKAKAFQEKLKERLFHSKDR
jgi:DDE superfamily endonuclease